MDKESTPRVFGMTDLPLEDFSDKSNKLGDDVKNYVNGLTDFVLNCNTPMSIALQGDWGTGKTSFINAMMKQINEINEKNFSKKVPALYFNTWQYSQLNQSDDLYSSFIIRIISELKKNYPVNENTAKKVLKTILSVTYDIGKQCVKNVTGYDVSSLDEFLEHEQEKAERIATLRESFANMIEEGANGNRVIIFVDDLDRLNPEKAVELLEVMKLFMDVEKCVFVLAIDYDVVVKGIKAKYGSEMTDDKCRSFFDKFVQVPFRMPVEEYNLVELLNAVSGERLEGFTEPLTELIKKTIGSNPRAFKRLFNSFDLISAVNEAKNKAKQFEQLDNALLFASLVVQVASNSTFEYLLEQAKQKKFIALFNEPKEDGEDYDVDVIDALKTALAAISNICKKKSVDNIYNKFAEKLPLSSITATIVTDRRDATKIDEVKIYEKYYDVETNTAADAMVKTFNLILSNKNRDKIKRFQNDNKNMLTFDIDDEEPTGYLRAPKKLDINIGGRPLYLGTSTSFGRKKSQTQSLCRFFGLPADSVQWLYKNDVLFRNT